MLFLPNQRVMIQVSVLGRLHHRNLVNLVGYCVDKGQHMLIYEFMSNGSLENLLYGKLVTLFNIQPKISFFMVILCWKTSALLEKRGEKTYILWLSWALKFTLMVIKFDGEKFTKIACCFMLINFAIICVSCSLVNQLTT